MKRVGIAAVVAIFGVLTVGVGSPLPAQSAGEAELPGTQPRPANPDEPWWAPWDHLPPGVYVLPVDSLYEFEANDPEEVRRQLDARGPLIEGERFFGQHSATWSYDFTWSRPGPGLCEPEDLRILARSVIVLPRLVNIGDVEPKLRDDWSRFLLALRDHEIEHRAIMRDHLAALRERLIDEGARSCSEFPAAFDPVLEAARAELRERQRSFDEETDHGALDGATWPPPRRAPEAR